MFIDVVDVVDDDDDNVDVVGDDVVGGVGV
jgi:hypothetical protein